jgi:hypothetical protein
MLTSLRLTKGFVVALVTLTTSGLASAQSTAQNTKKSTATTASKAPATPDQDFVCKTPGMGDDHFTVNFGAKTVRPGDVVLTGSKTPGEYSIVDVSITADFIKFTQKMNLNMGGVTLVRSRQVSIDRNDGTFISKEAANDAPTKGKCTSTEASGAGKK